MQPYFLAVLKLTKVFCQNWSETSRYSYRNCVIKMGSNFALQPTGYAGV